MSIQRYGAYGTQTEPEGEFVTFADYEANAARLGDALELSDAELAKWMARAAMEETQRKHAEAALAAERERVARLVGAIEDAPHAETCTARYTDVVGGMKVIGDFRPVRSVERPCNCWKRTALGGKKPCGECHLKPGERCNICGAQEAER